MKTKSFLVLCIILFSAFLYGEDNFNTFSTRFSDKKTSFENQSTLDAMMYYSSTEWEQLANSIEQVNNYYLNDLDAVYS